jgi:hypothetical protein
MMTLLRLKLSQTGVQAFSVANPPEALAVVKDEAEKIQVHTC